MSKRTQTWRELVDPELLPLLDTSDAGAQRIRHQVAELVDHLPGHLSPLQAADRVRSGALSAAGPAAAIEVVAIHREADQREEDLELHLIALSEAEESSRPAGYRPNGFVWDSIGLALGWVAALVTGVLAASIAAGNIALGTGSAIAGAVALFCAVVCALLERRRAASLVGSVRQAGVSIYGVLALFWIAGLVTVAVQVTRYDEVLEDRGTAGVAAWGVALVLMIWLVASAVGSDRIDVVVNRPVDPQREAYAEGLGAIRERVLERERRVFAALPADQQDAVLAGELEGLRLLNANEGLRPVLAREAVLDVRDRRRSAR